MLRLLILTSLITLASSTLGAALFGTGDLGIIIERASGSIHLINHSEQQTYRKINNLGDLSHASVVYSRDMRFGYLFGRDGGLSKVDLLSEKLVKRVIQAGNSIGGAISQDGSLIAVSNYEPGGVKIFDAKTLELLYELPAEYEKGKHSKVVGLVDAPGKRFICSLFEGNQIWVIDLSKGQPHIKKFKDVGILPYDALISPDGRYYLAGLFGEDGVIVLDLWQPEKGPRKILSHYGRGKEKLPVYKMPHLEGWAIADNKAYIPAVGRHELLVVNMQNWQQIGSIKLHGQPVFAMAQPDARQIWVNFAPPHNDTIQVIDTYKQKIRKTIQAGKGALHMEFTPRGEHVWISLRDEDKAAIYATNSLQQINSLSAAKPSGIFFTARAHKIGL